MTEPITLDVIPFNQPVGSFLLSVMKVRDVIRISRADPRKFDKVSLETVGGIQREPSRKRIKEIAEYARTVDAAFPTAILLALDDDTYNLEGTRLKITGENVADTVDGQHRILGLKEADIQEEFFVPVVFLLGATEEQKALIFATINGKQTKVPASVIYDLFGITRTRSPQKTAHEIARALNRTGGSPWYNRLKMLGKKTPGSMESLSQGTFIKFLLPCISRNPELDRDRLKDNQEPTVQSECVFNEYFRKDQDATILKILINVFTAARNTWPGEWDDPSSYTLTKTNGFTGIMKALPSMVGQGKAKQDLSTAYFERIFQRVKAQMSENEVEFTVEHFAPSSVGENKLRDMILEAMRGM